MLPHIRTKIAIIGVSVALSACQHVPNFFAADETYAGISPPLMHRHDDDGRKKTSLQGVNEADILEAEARPYVEYYSALKLAMNASPSDPAYAELIRRYIDKGITVVNVSCLRWFNTLAESQTRFNFTQGTQNVIQDLGTTLLGIGKANHVVTAAYGALFTGVNGLELNYSQSFLLAPNANKVKEHVFTALDRSAEQLRGRLVAATSTSAGSNADGTVALENQVTVAPASFSDAYMKLEAYADICTPQAAKEIINSALDGTTT